MPRKKRAEGTRAPNGASTIYPGRDGKWHGRVTVGVKDDGSPDRRHIERRTEAEVIGAVRDLERDRAAGTVRKVGHAWTVEQWLTLLGGEHRQAVSEVQGIPGLPHGYLSPPDPGSRQAHRVNKL